MSCSGRSPNASSARRAVPNRFVTSGNARAAHVGEEQRRPAGGDHAAVDLGGFEMRVDRRLDRDEVAIGAQPIQEGAEIGEHAVIANLEDAGIGTRWHRRRA